MPVSHPPPDHFFIEQRKVELYLLNLAHPDGRSKASFFIGWGFEPSRPKILTAALLDHPRTAMLADTSSGRWGLKFVYEGSLAAPYGTTPVVLTVWELRPGEEFARLVTAYRF